MQVKFWGIRGSLANGCSKSTRYGCNTACYTIEIPKVPYIIFDAGSGLRNLSLEIQRSNKPKKCYIFLTHNHWDHVSGLPFFHALYDPEWEVNIYAPENVGDIGAEKFLKTLFSTTFFPIAWDNLPCKKKIIPMHEGQEFLLENGTKVKVCKASHGGLDNKRLFAAALRIENKKDSLFYSGDHELGLAEPDLSSSFFEGMKNVDIAILDSQYTIENYPDHQGWGHSALEQWFPLVKKQNVKLFLPIHYDPFYDDIFLDNVCANILQNDPSLARSFCMSYEGLSLECSTNNPSSYPYAPGASHCDNITFTSEILDMPDMSSVLDSLLYRARQISNADAGTIYLYENNQLVFSYSHNDTLFTRSQSARQQYLNAYLPMTHESIAGYVACQLQSLNIADVRNLDKDALYSFNDSFDNATGYRTVSMCVLPIFSPQSSLLAVMQVINCLEDGKPVPFSNELMIKLEQLSYLGAQAIHQALLTEDMLLRILETARLRDPSETGPHVYRVGAMAAELYQHWAEKHYIDPVKMYSFKANLRLASMLHDVGKVGISDTILKKPGRFEPEERLIMEKHSSIGASIFKNSNRTLDSLAHTIALHHHQRWDGKGYTGTDDPPLAGEDIPLVARITSIVDVFDALISKRCYKDPMPVEKALDIIRKDSGTAFDPELVDDFFEILDTMFAIQKKYQEPSVLPEKV